MEKQILFVRIWLIYESYFNILFIIIINQNEAGNKAFTSAKSVWALIYCYLTV